MSQTDKKPRGGKNDHISERLHLAAIGMEAEFALVVDEQPVRPEDVFGDPRAFIRGPLLHRTGTSYHLPTGGIVYFDTGVIELATPVIELERGCAARAGRSLWESIRFVRSELDGWESRAGRHARLVGFSTHYNISFELPRHLQGRRRTVEKLALLLACVLPAPVMLLATNRRSTGVGVRPRGNRIEITVDFTPSAELMIATGTLITGIVRAAMGWRSFELTELTPHGIPVIAGYEPMPHTSRKGWLARFDCYPANPFEADIDTRLWATTGGEELSLRAIAARVTRAFWRSIRRLSDPFAFRLIASIMRGRSPSLLTLPDRPPSTRTWGGCARGTTCSRPASCAARATRGCSSTPSRATGCAWTGSGSSRSECAASRRSSSGATAIARATSSRSTICSRTSTTGNGPAWRAADVSGILSPPSATLLHRPHVNHPPAPANWPASWRFRPDATPVTAASGMVATTDRQASQVGVDALRAGGNAVDAAVATSFALAVVNPEAGNVGGGGFLVLRMGDGTEAAQDHRSTAPAAAARDMFVDAQGAVTEDSVIGHRSVAVPGTVRGLWDAHRRFGTRPWGELVQPAIDLARGFVVTERFLHSYGRDVVTGLCRFPPSARIFLPGDAPPRKGDVFRQPELAGTLERIRDRGADGFYAGETADLIVAEMERHGGLVTHADLAGYRTEWRAPVRTHYRGHTIVSMPPPSSGGVALAQICGLLEGFAVGDLEWHGARHVHLMAEAWRRAYADRNHYLADPAFADMPLDALVAPLYARWRGRDITLERATPSASVAPGVEAWRAESEHTTHLSIVDAQGGAASLTTTINSWYGSKVVVEGAGIVLNNDMDDFTSKPGTANQFGLVQGEANAIAPGKRMLSAMTPTIVLDPEGRLFLVVGTPGGSTIITTVFQLISNLIDHGMELAPAVLAPRVHHQHLPDQIAHEPGGLLEPVMDALRAMGHALKTRDEPSGDVEAILVRPDGTREGVADPRRGGMAIGY